MEVINNESNPEDLSGNKRKNRKRKKTFLQKAKKYAKKGQFGNGSYLPEDTYNYFLRVLEINNEGFATEEEKCIFANNVFEQTENEEINYSCNQIGSRVIEKLLPFANDQILKRYIDAFCANLRPICSDRYSSHVLQALTDVCCFKYLKANNNEDDQESITVYKDFTMKVGKFLLNNLEDFVNDCYGNHIIRTVLSRFSGLPKLTNIKPIEPVKEEVKNMPQEYEEIVKEYTTRLIAWPHFKDLPYTELTSGLLQIMLQALHRVDIKLLKQVQKKLLEEVYVVKSTGNDFPDIFYSLPSTILFENSMRVATIKIYTQLYSKCLAGHVAVMAKKKENQMTIQKLLNNCAEKTEFIAIFKELSAHFEEILQCGHAGVILAVAKACNRFCVEQGHFIEILMKALHCDEPKERQNSFAIAVAKLVPYERLEALQKDHYFVNHHGAVILQQMLEYNKPIKIITSILSQEPQELEKLFCDQKGSYVTDSFMTSQYIGLKSRTRLIRHMQGTYQNLANSKFGSRSFEAIWNVSDLKQRMQIMSELSQKDSSWVNSQFGKIIAGKVNMQLYKRNKEEWKQFMEKSNKTKDLFADILEVKEEKTNL